MNQNDYENYMTIDKETPLSAQEQEIMQNREQGEYDEIYNITSSIFEGGILSVMFFGETREHWLSFAHDELVDNENVINLLNPNLSDSHKIEMLNAIRELAIHAIMREAGYSYLVDNYGK